MEELDLKELFEIFWSKKIQIIIITLIFIVIGIVYSYTYVSPKYKSETSLLIVKQESLDSGTLTTTDLTLTQKLVSTYSELIKSKTVMRKVINNLNLDMSEDSLKSSITVSAVKDTEVIKITVVNAEPTNAKVIANEVVKVFTEQVKDIYNIDNVNVVDEAEINNTPYNINHKKDLVLFMLIGLVLAAVYVLVTNMVDTTIKNKDEIEKVTKLTVLTEIPLCDFNETKIAKRGGRR